MPPPNTPEEAVPSEMAPARPLSLWQQHRVEREQRRIASGQPVSQPELENPFHPLGTRVVTGDAAPLLSDLHERQFEEGSAAPLSADSDMNPDVPAERRPAKLDYTNLRYVTEVDENLHCPICQLPFYKPATTKCGHTFCVGCLEHALSISPRCPIDRLDLNPRRRFHIVPAARVITSLLDALQVKCPNKGCGHVSARSLIEHHYDYTCPYSRIPCVDIHCDKDLLRMDAEAEECLHRDVKCVHCGKTIMLAELDEHYDTDCADKTYRCEHCKETVARHKYDMHLKECKGREAHCRFQKMGCKFVNKHLDLPEHEDACIYRAIFMHQKPLEEALKALTVRLRATEEEIRSLRQDRQLAPDASQSADDEYIVTYNGNVNVRTSPARRSGDIPNLAAPDHDFILSIVENCESKVDNVEQYIREMDGRHSVMLLNELMPIKEQLTELRSNVGVMGMHVRWLMDHHRRRTTFQRVSAGAAGLGSPGPSMAGSAGDGGSTGTGHSEDDVGRGTSRRSHESQAPRL